MVFSTGYQANLGMISALAGKDDYLILDADSHASIYDGSRLSAAQVIRFRHNSPDDLYKRLKRLDAPNSAKLIVVEGIYSMTGNVAPMAEFAAVKRETGAYLMVDEATPLGCWASMGAVRPKPKAWKQMLTLLLALFPKVWARLAVTVCLTTLSWNSCA